MTNLANELQHVVSTTIRAEMADLRGFVDRRIAELSMEIHATVDLMDFSETNLSGQLGAIREQIASVVAMPAAATRNSGLELEAVVQATEGAANRIMEAAEAIGDVLSSGKTDPAGIGAMQGWLSEIFEACSFQDVTGQRIRRAIQHLQQVEAMLTEIVPAGSTKMPDQVPVEVSAPFVPPAGLTGVAAEASPDLAQDAVDSLFD